MKVLVMGANGQIGKLVVKKLQESFHTPIAMVRDSDQIEQFSHQGIVAVLGDLEHSIDSLQTVMEESNAEAVVFSAGSGGHTGADKTILIDLDGAIKAIQAAERVGVERFIMISAIGVHRWHDPAVSSSIKSGSYYSAAKYYADHWLQESLLDYTIIRPGKLTNDHGIGKIDLGKDLPFNEISRQDVASVIVASLSNSQTIRKAFDITNGEMSIQNALDTI